MSHQTRLLLIMIVESCGCVAAGQGCVSDTDCRFSLQCDDVAQICSCPGQGSVDIGAPCTPVCTDTCSSTGVEPGTCEDNQCGKF